MSSNPRSNITTIQDLPDECLRHIFLKVPMSTTPGRSWVSLRAVCKRWSPILDDCWHEIKGLALGDCLDKLAMKHEDGILVAITSKESLRRKTAEKLIEHCGPYLKSLIEFHTLPTTPSIMPLAAEKCLNLIEFTGTVRTRSEAKDLRNLLDFCTKLKILKIDLVAEKVYSFFQRIPTHQLEDMSMLTNGNADPHLLKYIKATIRHSRVLSVLRVDYMDEELLGLLTTLRELQISNPHPDLYILSSSINDKLLVCLSKSCHQLRSLALNQFRLTDEGISALSSLANLKTLHLFNLPLFAGKSLKNFSKIEELKLVGSQAGDAEMIGLLENCHVLRLLSMTAMNITDKTLAVAARVTLKRTNNITLKIFCANTKANPKNFQGVSPFLEVFQASPEFPPFC